METNKLLRFAALAEIGTGAALVIVPSLVGRLLLGEALIGPANLVARVTGLALIGLGVACWPGPPVLGMLFYSVFVTLYLVFLGLTAESTGILLWPAVALHLALSVLLMRSAAGSRVS